MDVLMSSGKGIARVYNGNDRATHGQLLQCLPPIDAFICVAHHPSLDFRCLILTPRRREDTKSKRSASDVPVYEDVSLTQSSATSRFRAVGIRNFFATSGGQMMCLELRRAVRMNCLDCDG